MTTNPSKTLFLFTFFLLIIFPLQKSYGCKVRSKGNMHLFISPEKQEFGGKNKKSRIKISKCKRSRNKYLMITGAPAFVDVDYTTSFPFTANPPQTGCGLTDSRLKNIQTYEEKKALYLEQNKFFTKCVSALVEDTSGVPIRPARKQVGNCKITKISRNKAELQGNFCFIKVHRNSSFDIQYTIKNKCLNPQYLKKNNMTGKEFTAGLSYLIAGNSSGQSTDLKILKVIPARFSINPPKKVIETTSTYGKTLSSWPLNMGFDLHFGPLKLQKSYGMDAGSSIITSFVVDHRCAKICQEKTCVYPCDYPAPLVAEFKLGHYKKNGKKRVFGYWINGGVIPPRWQGLLKLKEQKIEHYIFKPNQKYFLNIKFANPGSLYPYVSKSWVEFLIALDSDQKDANDLSPLTAIKLLPGLKGLSIMPQVKEITAGAHSINTPISPTVALNFITYNKWPPYIKKYCHPFDDRCVSARNYRGPYLNFTVEFEVDIDENTQDYVITNLKATRTSPILTKSLVTNNEMAKVKCF